MSDYLTSNWWETNAFEGAYATKNDGWEDLDGDLKMFIAIDEFLTGERKSAWDHERLVWVRHVQKLLHEERFQQVAGIFLIYSSWI